MKVCIFWAVAWMEGGVGFDIVAFGGFSVILEVQFALTWLFGM